jgi:hypothetical protein
MEQLFELQDAAVDTAVTAIQVTVTYDSLPLLAINGDVLLLCCCRKQCS